MASSPSEPDSVSSRPGLWPAYFKGHGLGNDYLVVESGDAWTATPDAVARVCRRHRGVGGDGIVCLTERPGPGEEAGTWSLRMFNPDGSEFERSGNGLRIFAAYLASRAEVEPERPFAVEVGGDRLEMTVHGRAGPGAWDVSVEMGTVELGPRAAGVESDAEDAGDGSVVFDHPQHGALDALPASVGNPHLVVFGQPLTPAALHALGPFLATHERVPAGANVQLVEPAGADRIRIRIWERGVGETSASGTSSCAAAVAAVERGLVEPGTVWVEMEGGELRVDVGADREARLRGPVSEVCAGRLTPGFLRALEPDGEAEGG